MPTDGARGDARRPGRPARRRGSARATSSQRIGIGSFGPVGLDRRPGRLRVRHDDTEAGLVERSTCAATSPTASTCPSASTTTSSAPPSPNRWGAAQGCAVVVYLTIGTGIGGGVVVDGRPRARPRPSRARPPPRAPASRRRASPELSVPRRLHRGSGVGPGDRRPCRRAGRRRSPPEHPVWVDVARELGELMAALVLAVSPQRIVIGGGVGYGQRWLLPRIREADAGRARRLRGGRRRATSIESLIVPAGLGDDAGPLAAVALGLARPRTSVADAADDIRDGDRGGRRGDPVLRVPTRSPSTVPAGFYTRADGGRAGRRGGSFLTSPEVGPLFGAVLARYLDAQWESLGRPDSVHRRRRRRRPWHARPGDPRGPTGVPARRCATSPSRSRRAQREQHPAGVESRADLPDGPFDGVVIANELLDNLPFRLCVFDGAWREAFVVAADDGTFGEVLSAPFDPPPPVLPPSPPHGARAPLHDAAVDWLADARSRLRRGRLLAIDYCAADDGSARCPPVAGVAAHLPRPRPRRPLPCRSRWPGHHRRARPRPVPGARRRAPRRRSSCSAGGSTSSWTRVIGEWAASAAAPDLAADRDAQPRRRGRGPARSRPAWAPSWPSSGRVRSDAAMSTSARTPSSSVPSAGERRSPASPSWRSPAVGHSRRCRRRAGRRRPRWRPPPSAPTRRRPRRRRRRPIAAASPRTKTSDPVRSLVPSIVAVDDVLDRRRATSSGRRCGTHRGSNTVAVEEPPGTLCAVVRVAAPLMAAGRWERDGEPVGVGSARAPRPAGIRRLHHGRRRRRLRRRRLPVRRGRRHRGDLGGSDARHRRSVGRRLAAQRRRRSRCASSRRHRMSRLLRGVPARLRAVARRGAGLQVAAVDQDVRVYGCPPDDVVRSFDLVPRGRRVR